MKRQLTIICFLMAGMLAGCSSTKNSSETTAAGETVSAAAEESAGEAMEETTQEFFQFEDETGNGQTPLVDYNETDFMKIDAMRVPWGEPLPYFHITEKMKTDFFWFIDAYRSPDFPGNTSLTGNVGMGPNQEEEGIRELPIGAIDMDEPVRQYVMVIVESGCVEVSFEDKATGEVIWESGLLTENAQFFKEFDGLHVEQPVLYIRQKKWNGEPFQTGVWHALFPHRTFIEENWEGFIDPYESTAADQQ